MERHIISHIMVNSFYERLAKVEGGIENKKDKEVKKIIEYTGAGWSYQI